MNQVISGNSTTGLLAGCRRLWPWPAVSGSRSRNCSSEARSGGSSTRGGWGSRGDGGGGGCDAGGGKEIDEGQNLAGAGFKAADTLFLPVRRRRQLRVINREHRPRRSHHIPAPNRPSPPQRPRRRHPPPPTHPQPTPAALRICSYGRVRRDARRHLGP